MNLLGSDLFDLDFLIIITAYLFLYYGQTPASIFAFGQGLLIDFFSAGLHGLFAFLYLSVFVGIYLGSRFFNLQEPRGHVLLISLAVLLKKGLFLMVLSAFFLEVFFSKSFLWLSGASAIATGLIAPGIFYMFDRLRAIISKETRDASMEDLQE